MSEVASDPFPQMWDNVKQTFGFNVESPNGGVECLQDAFGVVPFIRKGVGKVMGMGSVDK